MTEQNGEQTTVTPEQDGSGAPPAGTPDGSDRDAVVADLTEQVRLLKEERRLALEQWKPKAERVNELEAEVNDLRTRVAYQSPTQPDPRTVQSQTALDNIMRQLQEAEYDAANGDRNAALLVASLQQQYQMQQQVTLQFQMLAVPENDRGLVLKKLQSGRYGDVQAAYESVQFDRSRADSAKLAEKEAELTRMLEDRKRGVVGSGPTIPVSDRKLNSGEMTEREYAEKYDTILANEGPSAARAFSRKVVDLGNGKVRVG